MDSLGQYLGPFFILVTLTYLLGFMGQSTLSHCSHLENGNGYLIINLISCLTYRCMANTIEVVHGDLALAMPARTLARI